MFLTRIFERFVEASPVSVMTRALLEHAMSTKALNDLFGQHAEQQYTRELLFSTMVDLMSVVVAKIQPSVNAAYQAVSKAVPVKVQSVYNKLNGIEPQVVSAMVAHVAGRLGSVVHEMGGELPALLPKYRTRILDGNHLAATERRLEVLRGSIAGPLPGHALVVLDPQRMLATEMIACEDGHAQERSLSEQILKLVAKNDLWLADRNFCTAKLVGGIAAANAFYVIRQHANMTILSSGRLRRRGRTETGEVFEQSVTIRHETGAPMKARRIVVRLNQATRDGDIEMAILTNLPKSAADAVLVAELYRKRWTLETMFLAMTQMLNGEIDTLAYPRAALFGFGVALVTYNLLSTVTAALRAKFGAEKIQNDVSGYYIANEVRSMTAGMMIVLEPEVWREFQTMPAKTLAQRMLGWAENIDLAKYQRHARGPKKPVPKRTRYPDKTHVSTARLLAEAEAKRRAQK